MKKGKRRTYQKGRYAETLASLYLRLKGWRITAHRFKCPLGEIDLIARKGKVIAFIEVKARKTVEDGLTSIQSHQQARIVKAAEWWINQNDINGISIFRFDVIVICPFKWPYHLVNAFEKPH
jgi:putative endonuclease